MIEREATTLDDALAVVLDALSTMIENPERTPLLVGIDGRSGAGKTSIAVRLRDSGFFGNACQLVHLDSLYPGWHGLSSGAQYARDNILEPLHRAQPSHWRRYDWFEERYAEAHFVDPERPLIIEGCGILRRDTRPLLDRAIWIDAPVPLRRKRALERDGEVFRGHWDMWAEQEDLHIREEAPRNLADLSLRRRESGD